MYLSKEPYTNTVYDLTQADHQEDRLEVRRSREREIGRYQWRGLGYGPTAERLVTNGRAPAEEVRRAENLEGGEDVGGQDVVVGFGHQQRQQQRRIVEFRF